MKVSEYRSYDDLPLFLNAATVAKALGVAPSSSYELMHEADFPVLKIGNRLVVPKEKFIRWVEQHTQGDVSTQAYRIRDPVLPVLPALPRRCKPVSRDGCEGRPQVRRYCAEVSL